MAAALPELRSESEDIGLVGVETPVVAAVVLAAAVLRSCDLGKAVGC